MINQFGKTWWGEQWLNSLTNIDYENRLPRGRSYARKGAVETIKIRENQISAKVSGSRPRPYKVDIILPPFFDPQLKEFIQTLSRRPVVISQLLHRQLHPDVLEIAESCGLKVFPKQWSDFKMQCSCPDWAVPCKHLASVVYKVSAEIDNNPFLVFDLHRVDLLAEFQKYGVQIDKKSVAIPKLKKLYFTRKRKIGTYDPERAYEKLTFSKLTPIHEPLVALLSDFPAFYPGKANFKGKYAKKLSKCVKKAQKVTQGKVELSRLFLKEDVENPALTTHAKEKITLDEKLRSRIWINDNTFSFPDFVHQLSQVPSNKTLDYQPSTAALHSLLQFSIHLIANGAIVPQIVQLEDKAYTIRWLPAMLSREVKALTDKLEEVLPPDVFLWVEHDKEKTINNRTAIHLVSLFLTELMAMFTEKESADFFENLFFLKTNYGFNSPGEEGLAGGIMSWLQKYYLTQGDHKAQIAVSELPEENFQVEISVLDTKNKLAGPVPLKKVLTDPSYDITRFEILQAVTPLCSFITGLEQHINGMGKEALIMDKASFTPFLIQVTPIIQLLDVPVLLPKSLQEVLRPKPSIKLKKNAQKGRSFLRLDEMLSFDWQVAIGDTLMNEEEFRELLGYSEGLFKLKTGYIYVSKEELKKLYDSFSQSKTLPSFQLLQSALNGEYQGSRVSLTKEVQDLVKELTEVKEIPIPAKLKASLRPYQRRGYSWLYRNSQIGFGSVLADDMGLGKTLQVLTTLLKYKEEGLLEEKKALIVAPTGLLTNWEAEAKKFAPDLKTKIYHGIHRSLGKEEDFDLLITSYGILRSDAKVLKKRHWQSLIIDEAQNIKNVDTRQTRAVKSLPADHFIAMSGTPVENRLSELWSIMDYSNRGILGDMKHFNDTYGNPIQLNNDEETAEKLKKVTAPFLMRRLKTDRSIISDLPEKVEINSFAYLTKEQVALYEKTMEDAMNAIEEIDPSNRALLFQRQGLVLQMILALKQICNHPTQFLKNRKFDPSLSGKMDLLFDKLDSIMESGEKVLIFTQYTEMAGMLKQFINERYQEEPLYYHGGVTIPKRKQMVENFQTNHADKIFILSLKAAGTGLNLTAANHVIHYDLWWNPAVEAQATDRAYRIGQKNNVMVHRLITKNTFEEKINEMIQSKKALAEMTVATGEKWIGNLSNRELRDIFKR